MVGVRARRGSFDTGSFENSPHDRASVSALHEGSIPIGASSNLEVRQMLTHHQRLETTHTLSRDSAPCWLRELRRSRWRWSNGYALVPVDRDRVEEPPHGAAEEPPAPGEPGDRRVDRSAEHPHQRARPATGTGLRHQASPRFTPSAQTTAGFKAMVLSRTSEKPAWARAASISRPQAAEVSSLAPGPRG